MQILKDSTLRLYGTVGLDSPDVGFRSQDVRRALDEHGPGDITVNINSGGGYAFEGIAIYNMLKEHPGRVTMNVEAVAASAASAIVMAGDEIVMRHGALIMIHDPRMMTFGSARTHKKSVDMLERLAERYAEIYAARTKHPRAAIASMMEKETWFDADEAIESGFATGKVSDARAAVAAFDYSIYRHTPTALLNEESMDTLEEKKWAQTFLRSAEHSGLPLADLNSIIDECETIDAAKDRLLEKMAVLANADKPSPTGRRFAADQTYANPEFLAQAVGSALYARISGTEPESAARELAGRTVLDLGAMLLQSAGVKPEWSSRHKLAEQVFAYHSRSDFPNLLESSGRRLLLDAYTAAESPLKTLAKKRSAPDFRTLTTIQLSEMPQLDLLPEGGEIHYGTRAEAKESYRVRSFAKMFSLTREAIINDDLGAFSDATRAWGKAAAEREAQELAALLLANSGNGVTLDDNNPLYTTGRKNKSASGTAIDVANLGLARKAMREMVGLDGKSPINAAPKHLVVGPAKETEAEQVLASIAAAQVSNANPFSGKLTLHVDPRLPGNAWRLFADPALLPVIEYAYLTGAEGPQTSSKAGWNILGMEFRCVLDFGCGIRDWRGTYLNAGA